jgi:hypothetical protein
MAPKAAPDARQKIVPVERTRVIVGDRPRSFHSYSSR